MPKKKPNVSIPESSRHPAPPPPPARARLFSSMLRSLLCLLFLLASALLPLDSVLALPLPSLLLLLLLLAPLLLLPPLLLLHLACPPSPPPPPPPPLLPAPPLLSPPSPKPPPQSTAETTPAGAAPAPRATFCVYPYPYTLIETAVDRWATPPKLRKHRAHVLRELLSTETFYVSRLRHVINRFILPLRAAGRSVEANAVWRGWEPIAELHSDFLAELERAAPSFSSSPRPPFPASSSCCCCCSPSPSPSPSSSAVPARRIATAFSSLAPMLLLYIPFVRSYGVSLARLSSDLRSGGPISALCSSNLAPNGASSAALNDLLALPFQRLCKYGLLLRELARTFPHRRGRALREAVRVVDATVEKVNAAASRRETSERALQIQSALHVVQRRDGGHCMGRGFDSIWEMSSARREGGPRGRESGGETASAGGESEAKAFGRVPNIMRAHRRLVWEGVIGGGISVARLPRPRGPHASPAWEERWSVPGRVGCWVAIFTDLVLIAERRAPDKWKEERLELCWVCEVGALNIVDGRPSAAAVAAEGKSLGGPTELLLRWRRPSPYCRVLLRLAWAEEDARAAAAVCDVFRSLLRRPSTPS